MNHYETVFILTPVLSDKQTKEAVDKFKKLLKSSSAKINNDESWGLKKLAYPIQKKSTGFYFLIEFQGEGDAVKNFELELKRDERVIRWQTIKLEKFALEYADRRKKKLSTKTKAN